MAAKAAVVEKAGNTRLEITFCEAGWRPYDAISPMFSLICRAILLTLILLNSLAGAWADEPIGKPSTSSLADLLVSDRAEDATKGESIFAAHRTAIIAGLLSRIQTGDAISKGRGASELGIMISPWARGQEASARGQGFISLPSPRRPVARVPQIAEGASIRQCLQTAISDFLLSGPNNELPAYQFNDILNAFCDTLGEVATDDTMDWIIQQLQMAHSTAAPDPLIKLATSYLGIPPVFERGGYCGLTPPNERERFAQAEAAAATQAGKNLAVFWQRVRPMGMQDRVAFAIKSWRDNFIPILSSAGYYTLDQWIYQKMEALVRFGPPAVDMLRAQQSLESELYAKGVWEVIIAAITGREYSELVRELFSSTNSPTQEVACDIVLAASSKRWLRELDALQINSGLTTTKASVAIAVCHRDEGIPALRRAFAVHPDNWKAQLSFQELETRVKKGPPTGWGRYRFPE